jgi:hypothetical protein
MDTGTPHGGLPKTPIVLMAVMFTHPSASSASKTPRRGRMRKKTKYP